MKFFHISDLHIGKQMYGYSLLEDQQWILNQVVELTKEKKPDAILISGDVYDKSVPAAEAVSVLDHFLSQISEIEPKISVFIISGNHDSPERLSFAGEILERQKMYVEGMPPTKKEDHIKKVTMEDAYGAVHFWLLPFVKPGYVRAMFPEENIVTYEQAVVSVLGRETIDRKERNILLSHQFYTAGGKLPEKSDSEAVMVGGLDQVDIACLEPFDYVALGHIHRPQSMGRPEIRYCGTPLKYSVSEHAHVKTLTEVILGKKGEKIQINTIPFSPLRDVKVLRGKLEDIIAEYQGQICEDYVSIVLTDEQDLYQPKERLESIFTRILEVRMDNQHTKDLSWGGQELELQMDPQHLFAKFFAQLQGRELKEEETRLVEAVFQEVKE